MDMELCSVFLRSGWNFIVASIPYVIAYIHLKKLKTNPTIVMWIQFLILLVYVYFWIKLKDGAMICYQAIAYILAFVWTWVEKRLQKKDEK